MPRSAFSSSSLLDEITQRPLDPGYAAAARRRQEGPNTPPRPRASAWRRGSIVVVLSGAVLGLVVGAGVAQVRTAPLEAQDRAVLEAEVERRTVLADELAVANEQLRAQIEADQAAAIGEESAALLAATDRLGLVTGAVRATGDGVVVVLDDAPVDEVGADDAVTDDGRVRDTDVQTIVNGLWAVGAEGVAVNDQRLTTLSTIRHAGDAIVVDLRQLARPYTISAVGDPDALLAEVRTGQAGRYIAILRDNYGIPVSVEATDDVELPAASRVTLRHAEIVSPGDRDTPAETPAGTADVPSQEGQP